MRLSPRMEGTTDIFRFCPWSFLSVGYSIFGEDLKGRWSTDYLPSVF